MNISMMDYYARRIKESCKEIKCSECMFLREGKCLINRPKDWYIGANMQRVSTVDKRLNELMGVKRYTLRELSEISQVNYKLMSAYSTGARTPRLDTLCDIAERNNVDLRWLIGYNVRMEASFETEPI